jgi:hypothetical protein
MMIKRKGGGVKRQTVICIGCPPQAFLLFGQALV